jgi:hypothetical protein
MGSFRHQHLLLLTLVTEDVVEGEVGVRMSVGTIGWGKATTTEDKISFVVRPSRSFAQCGRPHAGAASYEEWSHVRDHGHGH